MKKKNEKSKKHLSPFYFIYFLLGKTQFSFRNQVFFLKKKKKKEKLNLFVWVRKCFFFFYKKRNLNSNKFLENVEFEKLTFKSENLEQIFKSGRKFI